MPIAITVCYQFACLSCTCCSYNDLILSAGTAGAATELTENAGLDIEGLICSGGHYRTGRCRTRLDIERRIRGVVMKFILMHVQRSYTTMKYSSLR